MSIKKSEPETNLSCSHTTWYSLPCNHKNTCSQSQRNRLGIYFDSSRQKIPQCRCRCHSPDDRQRRFGICSQSDICRHTYSVGRVGHRLIQRNQVDNHTGSTQEMSQCLSGQVNRILLTSPFSGLHLTLPKHWHLWEHRTPNCPA